MAIDFGKKKTGIAVTDPLRIIASPLDTILTKDLFEFLKDYFSREPVALIIVGEPLHTDGSPSQFHPKVLKFVRELRERFSEIPVVLHDETNSSMEAKRLLLHSGAKKKQRRDKMLVDKISASLILEDYLIEKGIH